MVLNTTFNNISVISWQSVLLVEEPGEPGENHQPVADKLYHIMLYGIHLAWGGFKLTTLVVIGTDCIGSNKSNYHTITTTKVIHQWIHIHMMKILFFSTFKDNIYLTSTEHLKVLFQYFSFLKKIRFNIVHKCREIFVESAYDYYKFFRC
jgi:hypothetical protein